MMSSPRPALHLTWPLVQIHHTGILHVGVTLVAADVLQVSANGQGIAAGGVSDPVAIVQMILGNGRVDGFL